MQTLSPPEADALHALWQCPAATGFVKDIREGLPAPRPAYTTLASTLRNLERKRYVEAEKLGNALRYTARVSAEDFQRQSLGAVVARHFANSYKELVSFFARDEKISAADLQDILRMIREQKPE